MNIYFTGYTKIFFKTPHTNYWPWQYLVRTINEIGYKAYHLKLSKIDFSIPHIFICWNLPDSLQLIEKYNPHKDSIIIQKLTPLDMSAESKAFEANSTNYFDKLKNWTWPQYKKLEKLENTGYQFYAFGAKTDIKSFDEKRKIVKKYKNQIFWIPWGSMTIPYQQILKAKPILSNFKYDAGYVGSKWGTYSRGNVWEWDNYLAPIIESSNKSYIAGPGTQRGVISIRKHIKILKQSRICPIIHATVWKTDKGVMDRFWTVFALGRFGVIDNEGIYDFFDEKDVVVETDSEGYVDKSIYFMNNLEKQKKYIENVQKRIKAEYNQHVVWKNILSQILNK